MTTDFAKKTSLKVPYQLPEFIRSDDNYQTFVAFIQAYYEWMEQQNIGSGKEGVIYGTQNLLNYQDIDFVEPGETFNKFIDYYINQFLPNFPADCLADKSKLIRMAKELYSRKGTPASYQFLFRALYNSDADIFLTRDVIFKASDGKWYVSKSLRLATNDEQWLSINNYRLFGETSKSIATVERSVAVGNRMEVYIANIERLFVSGEDVVVVDNNNQILYFKDSKVVTEGTVGATPLRAKILGSISAVNINSTKRGQLYNGRTPTYSGDPVVFYGGLNTANGIGATAFVYETTTGSLRDITVVNGSYGYRPDPNTYIRILGGGGSGAIANVGTIDPTGEINVAFVPQNYMSPSLFAAVQIGANSYPFFPANTSANSVCSLANAFTFVGFSTYPITSILLNNGGGGYKTLPSVKAFSLYDTTDPQTTENLKIKGYLATLGMLGPIQIVTPGTGYANGDIINFTDSAGGVGARANVKVNATGSITSTEYIYSNTTNQVVKYPKNGLGYKQTHLPTLTVTTSGGSGASLRVNTVLGDGAELTPVADERGIGAITSFIIENYGEDYIEAPKISLKVRDLMVTNVSPSNIIKNGDLIYQGANVNTAVFKAYVDSITLYEADAVQANSKYVMRVYNYTSNTKTNLQLKSTDRAIGADLYLDLDTNFTTINTETGENIYQNGVRTYGNGAAVATAKFLNGLIIGTGQYLNDDGFPSSNQILENEDYNNFTYDLTVQKSFDAYKEVLFKLLHPSGTKVIPINALKSQEFIDVHKETAQSNTHTLGFYTGDPGSNATMYSTFENASNNIIVFDALVGANIENIAIPGSLISLNQNNGPNVFSEIISVAKIDPATNFFRQSEDFSTTWTATNAIVTVNPVTAPDGTTTADKIGANLISGTHSVQQSYTVANNTTYNYSVYVKPAEENVILLRATSATEFGATTSQFCTFNVISQAVTVGAQGVAGSGQIVSVGNGWYRCNVATVPTVAAGSVTFTLMMRTSSSYTPTTAGDGLYLWGAQLNTGNTVNRYIKTTTAALTDSGGSNTAVIRDNVFLSFANVATANVMTSNNRINILSATGQYDVINDGQYSNTANEIRDIIFTGDRIRVVSGSNTFHGTVSWISYSNNVIGANTTIPFTSNTANVSIGRTLVTSNVEFYNSLGTVYYPELITQDDMNITTQDNREIILG